VRPPTGYNGQARLPGEPGSRRRPMPTEQPTMDRRARNVALLAIIALIGLGFILRVARSLFIPLVASAFLAYLMDPPVVLLKRARLPLLARVSIVAVLYLGVALVLGLVLRDSILDFLGRLPAYQERFLAMLRDVLDRVQALSERLLGYRLQIQLQAPQVRPFLLSLLGSLAGFSLRFILVFIFAVLIVIGKHTFGRKVRRSFPRIEARRLVLILAHMDRDVRRYIGVKSAMGLLAGFAGGLVLALWRVELAVVLGFLIFVLNFIPYVGPVSSALLPAVVALVQYRAPMPALWILLIIGAWEAVVLLVLEPRIVGYRLKMTVPALVFTLFLWGGLWGAPGVLLGVPITISLKIIMENIPRLRPLGLLLEKLPRRPGRRPAGPR
jgi:AI-2 transport protein TqsA